MIPRNVGASSSPAVPVSHACGLCKDHQRDADLLVEIVDPDTGSPLPPGTDRRSGPDRAPE